MNIFNNVIHSIFRSQVAENAILLGKDESIHAVRVLYQPLSQNVVSSWPSVISEYLVRFEIEKSEEWIIEDVVSIHFNNKAYKIDGVLEETQYTVTVGVLEQEDEHAE